jgi:hypothetical protein
VDLGAHVAAPRPQREGLLAEQVVGVSVADVAYSNIEHAEDETSLKFLASFDAYDIAMKAGGETKAVDNWGPSYLRDETVGGDWTMGGKGLPAYVKTPVPSGELAADDILTMTIAPMQAWAIKLNVTSEVFAFVGPSGRGMVRFSDGTTQTLQAALGQPFCIKAGGCACPQDSPGSAFSFQTVAPGEVWVGFTGHTDGLDIDIEGFNMPDACKKSPGDLHVPEPCYCGGSLPDMFGDAARRDYLAFASR